MDGSQGPSEPTACELLGGRSGGADGAGGPWARGILVLGEATAGARVTRAAGMAAIIEEDRLRVSREKSCWLCRACFGIGGRGLGMIGRLLVLRGVNRA
jgi:hypothetical protein